MDKRLMLGNEAIARGAYEAGVGVISSYPGTPSTEITEYASAYKDIYTEWAPNEKVSVEVAMGAAIGGARAMSAMKHVGLNVAADPLFTLSYTGVNAGMVICVADDPGMHSSQNEQDSRHYARASKTLMLEPSDSAECLEFVKQAYELSEQYDTPVLVRLSTRVSHSQGQVTLGERTEVKKEYTKNIRKFVMMPAMARERHIKVEERIKTLTELAETTTLNRAEYHSRKIGIISSGIAYQYAREALGENASYLKLGMVYPLPEKLICDFVNSVETCYVVEELDPYIETHIKAITGKNIHGKDIFPLLGEYSKELVAKAILNEESPKHEADATLPMRPPVMCPGCPHRGVYFTLSRMGIRVLGDIGCYTLGALAPFGAMDTCICMGAGIGVAHGMEKAGLPASGGLAIIGDSTFIHSGITGLIDVVYNKGNSTVLILDNSITGMTGHQHNPTTGYTISNDPTAAVDLEMLCKAVGVKRVRTADPFDVDALRTILTEELAANEPSVVIARRPCALLKSVKLDGKYQVNDKCKKCGVCTRGGCPAIAKREDGTAHIDTALCIGCAYCVNLCKFGAIEKV